MTVKRNFLCLVLFFYETASLFRIVSVVCQRERERVWSGKWEVSVNTAGVFVCRHSEVSGKVVSTDMGGASFADFPHLFNLNTHFSIAVFVMSFWYQTPCLYVKLSVNTGALIKGFCT